MANATPIIDTVYTHEANAYKVTEQPPRDNDENSIESPPLIRRRNGGKSKMDIYNSMTDENARNGDAAAIDGAVGVLNYETSEALSATRDDEMRRANNNIRNNSNNLMASKLGGNGEANDSTVLQNFYNGQNILITGGTGFLGKILIEKLLRSCPGVENIYLVVRTKKGKDVYSRIEEMFDDPVFERLKKQVPKFRHKIVIIPGDCNVAGFGLNLHDRQTLLTKVNIVFHGAATVKFDEKLRLALAINVRAVKEMLDLCRGMRELKVIMHVSTAFSNCNRSAIDERIYASPTNYEDLTKLIDKKDDDEIEDMLQKILGDWPNTYTFTKALAENVAKEHSKGLTVGIFRPAIVTSTAEEPVPGWTDNLYGPTGVTAGAATGIMRSINCDANVTANVVPVDMCVNALITAAWDVATTAPRRDIGEIPVYNYCSSPESRLTWGDFMELNVRHGFSHPLSSAIWYFCLTLNRSTPVHRIYSLFFHIIPALIVDSLAVCSGQKPKLLKVYSKVHKLSNVLKYFCVTEIHFSNRNVQELWKKLDVKDQKIFSFSIASIDWIQYFRMYIRGIRLYLFKEDDSTLEAAKRKWSRFYYLHQTFRVLCILLLSYGAWRIFYNLFTYNLLTYDLFALL